MIALTNDPTITARIWMETIWSRRDLTRFEELHAPHFVDHSPSGRRSDRESYKLGIVELFEAFPDFRATTEDLIADCEAGRVAIRWSAAATHLGPFMGRPASGLIVDFRGIEVIQIDGGRLVERWGEWDGIGLLEQISRAANLPPNEPNFTCTTTPDR